MACPYDLGLLGLMPAIYGPGAAFRNCSWALQHARTVADYKAITMHLMHDNIRVTDGIYAPLLRSEVRERVSRLAELTSPGTVSDEGLVEYLRQISKGQVPGAAHPGGSTRYVDLSLFSASASAASRSRRICRTCRASGSRSSCAVTHTRSISTPK
jgi:hypothetical protein